MDDRVSIPNIGTDATGPVGAGIGVQGGPNPRDIINIAFPPGAMVEEAAQIAALAQAMHKRCPPNLYQTFNGQVAQSATATCMLDFTPEWWVIRGTGLVGKTFITIAQGFSPTPGQNVITASGTSQSTIDFAGYFSATLTDRIVLPGTSNVLFIVGDTGATTLVYNIAALGADYDPSKVY